MEEGGEGDWRTSIELEGFTSRLYEKERRENKKALNLEPEI